MSGEPAAHTGPVQVRFHDHHVVVLCPFGHLVTSARLDHTWAGSDLEARISSHQHRRDWVVTCHGALPHGSNAAGDSATRHPGPERSGNIARHGQQQLLGQAFLHRSLVPLDQVDLSTPEDRGQGVLFDDHLVDECGLACPSAGVPSGFEQFPPR